MRDLLTASDFVQLDKIHTVIELLKDNSCLIILSVDTKKLNQAFKKYFRKKNKAKEFDFRKINNYNIIQAILGKKVTSLLLIDLFQKEDTKNLLARLNYHRDDIFEHELKLILMLDKESIQDLKQDAFDLFSRNNFAYDFIDHSFSFDKSQIATSDKLEQKIRAYEALDKSNLKANIHCDILNNIAMEAVEKSENKIALQYFNTGLEVARDNKIEKQEAVFLGNIGNVYLDKGYLDNALKHYNEALLLAKKNGYQQGIAAHLGNIGNVHAKQGDLENALKHHNEALSLDKKIGYQQGIANVLGNIGNVYLDKGDLDNALKHYNEALLLAKKIGYQQGIASDLGNIGNVYSRKGDLGNANKYYRQSLKLAEIIDNQSLIINMRNKISQIQSQIKPNPKADS